MQFHAVESALVQAARCIDIELFELAHAVEGEFDRHFAIERAGDGRGRDQRQARGCCLGLASRVTDLAHDFRAGGVDRRGQTFEAGQHAVVMPHQHAGHHATARMHADILGDDQREAAARARHQVIMHRVGDGSVRVGEIGGHRRHHEPVGQGDRAQGYWCKQLGELRVSLHVQTILSNACPSGGR